MEASPKIQKYFERINSDINLAYSTASSARKKGYDPEESVDVKLAKDLVERVEGLIGTVAPQLIGSGMIPRLRELEKEFSPQDWRVALIIAHEVAEEKFCKFKDKKEAMEVGIRVGFAYHTVGIVSAPLEGITELKIKKTRDGKEYFAMNYAGPIRGAGGTGAAVSLLIADYVRKKMGYEAYDPDEKEINRIRTELLDYHERITNLQYRPSNEEITFLIKNCPVEIEGDGTEKIEVSNYKDLPRIETNQIRGGVCLVASMLALKAPKLWKQLNAWGKELDLDWMWLEQFLKIQKSAKSAGETKKQNKIAPDYTFIQDLVAGRPVITHPLKEGGLRLRYGRSRTSGYSAASIHPATMEVLDRFIALGTQLKTERPGKAATITSCDSILGPVVKLNNGDVLEIDTVSVPKNILKGIEKIIFLGDILFSFGDFFDRAHVLVPPGYCEEWHLQKIKKASKEKINSEYEKDIADFTQVSLEEMEMMLDYSSQKQKISASSAIKVAMKLDIPLHPKYTYFWTTITKEEFIKLIEWLESRKIIVEENDKANDEEYNKEDNKENNKKNDAGNYKENEITKIIIPYKKEPKEILENLCIPHLLVAKEFVVIEKEHAISLIAQLNLLEEDSLKKAKELIIDNDVLQTINYISKIKIMDKAGIFIGARMGRPEKAKQRELTGSPHMLFPVGSQGGVRRSLQSSLDTGFVESDFAMYKCECGNETVFSVCELCEKKTERLYKCKICGLMKEKSCEAHGINAEFSRKKIEIKKYVDNISRKIQTRQIPELVKGVRGTSNREHIPEHLAKGLLRAKHDIYVNKDGTTRYDMTEAPITHFKPKEIETSIETLKTLGYDVDINGYTLENEEQILEILPQDIILPACPESPDEKADTVLFRVANFVDELLTSLYKIDPFYNLKSKKDLAGHLVIGIAPHISAGIIGRIIGFSKTQMMLCSPLYHAAMRRDCVHHDTKIFFHNEKNQETYYDKIGTYVEQLLQKGARTRIIDGLGTKAVYTDNTDKELYAFGIDPETHDLVKKRIKYFIKGPYTEEWVKITTATNREYFMTPTHKMMYLKDKKFEFKEAKDALEGDKIPVLEKMNFFTGVDNIDLIKLFKENLSDEEKKCILVFENKKDGKEIPLAEATENAESLRCKFSRHILPAKLKITPELMRLMGYYTAEGYSRTNKWVSQVSFRACDRNMQEDIINIVRNCFNMEVNLAEDNSKITICSKLIYFIFKALGLGKGAYDKRVPSIFFGLKNDLIKEYIAAYFDGDGSIIKSKNIVFYSVSRNLLDDISLLLTKFGVLSRYFRIGLRSPGKKVLERYKELGKEPKKHILNHLILGVYDSYKLSKYLRSYNKNKILKLHNLKPTEKRFLQYEGKQIILAPQSDYVEDVIKKVEIVNDPGHSYCVEIDWRSKEDRNILWGEQIINTRCDGDESCVILLMDALLNFSRKFLPDRIGARTMDSPLVLTSQLDPSEVDDMVHRLDTAWIYPLEFYEATLEYKQPWDKSFSIPLLGNFLHTEKQYEQIGFTHDTSDINAGVICSAYKTLPSMEDKLRGQMLLADKIRAVNATDVARLVIEKHFIRDIRGNLRKFSGQEFRCVKCNEKYPRPPLIGKCRKCGNRLMFTISEGSVIKYMEPSLSLSQKYEVGTYLRQSLDLTKRRIEEVFGKDKERQEGLGRWFG